MRTCGRWPVPPTSWPPTPTASPSTTELVRLYFGGRAEVKGFAVADAAIEGKASEALEQLRWAFAGRVDPVLITSAVAGGLRALARYTSAPRGLREGDLAREVGVPPWKLKSLAVQSRGGRRAGWRWRFRRRRPRTQTSRARRRPDVGL